MRPPHGCGEHPRPGGVRRRLRLDENSAMTDSDDDRDRLDPREDARAKRRDRDADAQRRDLMRPGMGKVFKQIQDSWAEKAALDQDRARSEPEKGRDKPR